MPRLSINSGVTEAVADGIYLRLDGSNDPVTGFVRFDAGLGPGYTSAFPSGESAQIAFTGDSGVNFGAGDIVFSWDDSNDIWAVKISGGRTGASEAQLNVGTIYGSRGAMLLGHFFPAGSALDIGGSSVVPNQRWRNVYFTGNLSDGASNTIAITNLLDKTANESISGLWNFGWIGIGATAPIGPEVLRLQTSVGAYGWIHDDGTRQLGSWVDALGGYIGTRTAHDLWIFTADAVHLQAQFLASGGTNFLETVNMAGDNLKLFFGAGNDASIYYSGLHMYINPKEVGSGTLRITGILTYVGDNSTNPIGIVFDGPTNDGILYWYGNSDYFRFWDDVYFNQAIAVGIDPSTTVKARIRWDYTATPTSGIFGLQGNVIAGGATETANDLFGADFVASIDTGSVNEGRNFSRIIGGRFRSLFQATHNVTWASNPLDMYGGRFESGYIGSGNLSASTISFISGQFIATATANPSTGTTIDNLIAGQFQLAAGTAAANLTLTDAIGLDVPIDVSGPGTVTRLYGIRVAAFTGSGSTEWGINCEEDIQVASDAWYLMEGSLTAKGDTGVRYDSGNTRMQFQVNGTDNLLMGATTLGVFATTPVAQQTVTGSRGGNAALASLLTALANYGLIVDSTS